MILVGMVTTKTRREYREASLRQLADPDIQVFEDLAEGGTKNHMAAWLELFRQKNVALLLQDDVIAVQRWRPAVELFLEQFEGPVAFYSALSRTGRDEELERGYSTCPGITWRNEQALALRRNLYERFLDWVVAGEWEKAIRHSEFLKSHDYLLATFLRAEKITVTLSAPSLFQHVGRESSLGNPWKVCGRARQSSSFPGEEFDALEHFMKVFNG